MAFFNLTHLGYQDTIREHMREPAITPQYIYRYGLYRQPESIKLPPIDKSTLPEPSIVPINQISGYGPGPMGSHLELSRLRNKHIRNPKEPRDVYRRPVTTSQQIASWRKDEALPIREPWTAVKRHVTVNSEMTKFVNEMSLTNREFSLF